MTPRASRGRAARRRRQPERTCVVCRRTLDRSSLVRLARRADGAVVIDLSGKGPGRGAYLCAARACWADARLAQRLGRALKVQVTGACLAELADFAATLPEDAGHGFTGD